MSYHYFSSCCKCLLKMASVSKNCIRVFLSIVILAIFCDSVAFIPRVLLYSQKEFDGNVFAFPLYPGCNNIWMFGWDKTTASLANNRLCIVIWDNMYCQGRSLRITEANEDSLRNLADVGFVHRFRSGVSSIEKCQSEVCTALGTFIKPGYCTKYFRCLDDPDRPGNFIKKNFACPPKEKFDPKLGHCNTPDKVFPQFPCNDTQLF